MMMMNKMEDDERVVLKEETGSCTTENTQNDTLGPSRVRLWVRHLLDTYKYQVTVVSLVIFNSILVIVQLVMEHRPQEAGHFPHVLSNVSLALLSLFLAEVCVKIYAFGTSYLHRKFEMFDALVVFVTFTLRLLSPEAGFGLVIVFRLWRVVKILNGVVKSVKAPLERMLERERRVKESLEDEVEELRHRCASLKERLVACEGLLVQRGIPVPESIKVGEQSPKVDPN